MKVKRSGAYAVKGASVSCPTESAGACVLTLAGLEEKDEAGLHASIKIAAGKTASLAGKLTKKGLKQLKPKGTKTILSVDVTVPDGDSASGSLTAILVPPKKKPRQRSR